MTMPTFRDGAAVVLAIALIALGAGSPSPGYVAGQNVTSNIRSENVRFAPLPGGLIEVTYDLVSDDPRASVSVTLEVSDDGGQTWNVTPRSLMGAVGDNVTPGAGKRIVWDAGKDVEILRVDQFQFRLKFVPSGPSTGRAAVGVLSVQSTPGGATVLVDGQSRGLTPLLVGDLSPGSHQLTVRRTGYLDNRSTVLIRADVVETVTIVLTAVTAPPTPAPQSASQGSGRLKWLLLGGAGAAVAGVAAGKGGGGGNAPSSTTTTIIPQAVLTVSSTPNPVPFRVGSGQPCNGTAGFWTYDETVRETAGVSVTITQIHLRFLGPDPFPTSPGSANDVIPANGNRGYSWFWCFTPPITRMVRSTYAGRDANGFAFSFDGPIVVLSPGPGFQ
jgi:hypothetical protein